MQSLLGQFYTRIKGSQEDIASEGLVYILARSRSARDTIQKIIKIDCGVDLPDLSYMSQSSGTKLERPDITGRDDDGTERLIIEAKFWASLTDNQPVEYLNRLAENSVLVFVCPTLRIRPIYSEVQKRLNAVALPVFDSLNERIISLTNNRFVIIKTWDEMLGAIKLSLSQENNPILISDIDQIIGFCNTIDNETFLPITSEDMSPSIARRINSYYDLIDKVTDELKKRNFADTQGSKAQGQKYGYSRFFRMGKYGVSLNLKYEYWAVYAETPFWTSIKETDGKNWITTGKIGKIIKDITLKLEYTIQIDKCNDIYIALKPPIDKTEDWVINNIADQIITLVTEIDSRMNLD